MLFPHDLTPFKTLVVGYLCSPHHIFHLFWKICSFLATGRLQCSFSLSLLQRTWYFLPKDTSKLSWTAVALTQQLRTAVKIHVTMKIASVVSYGWVALKQADVLGFNLHHLLLEPSVVPMPISCESGFQINVSVVDRVADICPDLVPATAMAS